MQHQALFYQAQEYIIHLVKFTISIYSTLFKKIMEKIIKICIEKEPPKIIIIENRIIID